MDRRTRHRGLAVVLALSAMALLVACGGSEDSTGGDAAASWTRLDPAQLSDTMQSKDVFLVNVHVPYEGEIPGTDAFIAYDQITAQLDALPSDPANLVIYCRSGNMSTVAAQALVDAGVTGFSELEGGYNAWVAAGYDFVVEPAAG